MKCVSGHKPLLFIQLCLNTKSAGWASDWVLFCATHSTPKAGNQYNQKWVSSSFLHFMSVYTYILCHFKHKSYCLEHQQSSSETVNNYSTYIDIPYMKWKLLKMSELFKCITIKNPI